MAETGAGPTESVERDPPIRRITRPLKEFDRIEASEGIVLLGATLVALVWANSAWAGGYDRLWATELRIGGGGFELARSLRHWINDGLMAVFFFVVGLEIKRELLVGELASPRRAALPIAAAAGGMLLPALIYAGVTWGTPASRGWGVPMATDIAFALGALGLLGRRVPPGLIVFLTAVAIVDDIGAVSVIALFYSHEIVWGSLAAAGAVLLGLAAANRLGVRSPVVYAAGGLVVWAAMLESGVHATIAGVLVAMTVPASLRLDPTEFAEQARAAIDRFLSAGRRRGGVLANERRQEALHELERATERVQAPIRRLEHGLHGWVAYGVMPLFALANAGLPVGGDLVGLLREPAGLGVVLGLIVGKQAGVTLFAWLVVRLGLARLPARVGWGHVYGAAWLAGIGFTMSLFITGLAFDDPELARAAKVGVLVASLAAGGVGLGLLWRATRAAPAAEPPAGGENGAQSDRAPAR